MVGSTVGCLKHKPSLRSFAHKQVVAGLQLVELGRKRSVGHQFEEKLDFIFGRRGRNRIRALDALTVFFDTERGVLSGKKVEALARLNAEHPKVWGEVNAPGNPRMIKPVVRSCHLSKTSRVL